MLDFQTLEPAIDPNNRISFLLDWELTMKCNLDCSYCPTGIYGGHDNSQKHPKKSDCFDTIDFMFEYADIYMSTKINGIKYVILNIYGGESLHHPDIVEILERCREVYNDRYADRWHLTITCTTNAIISDRKFDKIVPLIDEFTTSYHSENTPKQKQQFRRNLLAVKSADRRLKCVVLMHTTKELFKDTLDFQQWCRDNDIRILPRQLDYAADNYDHEQSQWFNDFYNAKQHGKEQVINFVKTNKGKFDLTRTGRACCGGRQVCLDKDYKGRVYYVKNSFTDWYCSVNEFFVYIKQVNGEIFVNKDCQMNFQGEIGPIGTLKNTKKLLDETRTAVAQENRPVIQCKKQICLCGLCAPKSRTLDEFNLIMDKYRK